MALFEKSFEHDEALFNMAVREFIAFGYEQASINRILNDAGMSKGQFYYHFKTKEGLYLALTDVLIAKKVAFMAEVMNPEDFQQDIFTIFKIQIQYGIQFAQTYPVINQFADSFLKEKGNQIYETALARHNFENNDAINMLVEAAYHKGEFREDLPLPFVKKSIGYLFTNFADLIDLNSADEAQENLNYLVDFLRAGLGKNLPEDVQSGDVR